MEFAINLTTKAMAYAVDWCGVRSGRQYNKFEEIPLTPAPSKVIKAPIVKESPLSIECRVREVIPLGSHDMFLSEVVHVQVEDSLLDPETGAFQLMNADLLAYSHGFYHELGPLIGRFGWSVRKKK
jgi:flavin reductase (DIM6/NTAB) family NADH-FMN oxidoreductase RutF